MSKADSLFEQVTRDVIAAIEAGAGEWKMPWQSLARPHVSLAGRPYRGINVWMLTFAAEQNGYASHQWGTYKAWSELGHHVRKGEKATHVALWKPSTRPDPNDPAKTKESLYTTTFSVFAREQIDDADNEPLPALELGLLDTPDRIAEAEVYLTAIGADVREGGDRAFYAPVQDYIGIPTLAQFRSAADYYSTLAHEHTHWTGHESRLKRELRNRFGSEAYAAEELIAELGAAFWCAQMGISQAPRPDHAQYLSHWLRILRADSKALLTASSQAQKAIDHLNKVAGHESIQEVAA